MLLGFLWAFSKSVARKEKLRLEMLRSLPRQKNGGWWDTLGIAVIHTLGTVIIHTLGTAITHTLGTAITHTGHSHHTHTGAQPSHKHWHSHYTHSGHSCYIHTGHSCYTHTGHSHYTHIGHSHYTTLQVLPPHRGQGRLETAWALGSGSSKLSCSDHGQFSTSGSRKA